MNDGDIKTRIRELEQLITKKKAEKDYYKAMQLAFKLVLNGSYGAFANKYFVCSNADIANSITSHGRDVNQYMLYNFEQHFYREWHLNKKMHRKLGMEYICKKGDKYQAFDIDFEPIGYGVNSLNELLRIKNLSVDDLFKSTVVNSDIEVLYEYRLWDFSNVQPLDENPTWGTSEGREKYMGDNQIIIYGDTDSLYFSYAPIMKSVGFDKIDDLEWGRRLILHIDAIYTKPLMTKYLDEYAAIFGVKNLHDFELETISKSALFLKKKHYLNNIVYEDGVFYEDLKYFYPKGIEIIRSSTPLFVRKNIYRVINYLFSNVGKVDIYEVLRITKQIKKEFELSNIEDISMTTSCSNYNDKVLDDTVTLNCVKGAHFGVKASAFHNYLLNKNSKYKTKYDMIKSGRIKYYYCKHSMADVFAYMRSFHPIEIVEKENVIIDIDTQFDKSFLTIVNKFTEPLGLPTINERLSIKNSLFNF
jgi:DNA polymerase elongation subunit (family B)